MKPKLLVVELWGLGDLALATPFLRAANDRFQVTLLAKPYSRELQSRLWPELEVIPFTAPWTAFQHKYRLWRWPWLDLGALVRQLRRERFAVALSARWDPRDHLLLFLSGARTRLGFPRLGSQRFLTRSLVPPPRLSHRYELWRTAAQALDLDLPTRDQWRPPVSPPGTRIVVHSGAGQPVRVWPLDRLQRLVARLRQSGQAVQVLCDPAQRAWWLAHDEPAVVAPVTTTELLQRLEQGRLFIGNDSGPGHLAAILGLPTFTVFGPQLPEWFAPLHPAARWIPGRPCQFKPCFDVCRFPEPCCLLELTEPEVWAALAPLLAT